MVHDEPNYTTSISMTAKNKQNLVLVIDPEEQQIRSCPDNSVDPVTEITPTTSPAPCVTQTTVIPYVRNGDQPLQICYDEIHSKSICCLIPVV